MSKSFWKTDWFIGVVVSVVVLFAGGGELLQSAARAVIGIGNESKIWEGVEGVQCSSGRAEFPERLEVRSVAPEIEENGGSALPIDSGA